MQHPKILELTLLAAFALAAAAHAAVALTTLATPSVDAPSTADIPSIEPPVLTLTRR